MKDWGLAHRFAGSATGRRYRAWSTTRCARKARPPGSWASQVRAPKLWARSDRRATSTRGDRRVLLRRGPRAGKAHGSRTRAARRRRPLRRARPCRRGFPRVAYAATRGELWRVRSGRGQGARRARAGRPAREPLKTTRDKALAALAFLAPQPTPFSPLGLRIAMRQDGRAPPLASDPAYVKGLVEVQDEGSQLAALLAEAKPSMQVLDLCAGAGGKTLALAAAMENQGQIYAADPDPQRLAPIFARLARSGARNVQVRAPRGQADVLADLKGRCDLVLIDAPAPARRLAAQPRRQMAHPPRRARAAHQGSGRDAGKRVALRQARQAHRLCDLLRPAGRERGPDRRVHAPPRRSAASRRRRAGAFGWFAGARQASVDAGPGFRLSPRRPARTAFMSRP